MRKSSLPVLVITLTVALLTMAGNSQSQYTPHRPIRILGDGGFVAANGVLHGSGTADDPYVIAAVEIDAAGHEYGIAIEHTTAYFVIRDCKVHGANSSRDGRAGRGSGIYLSDVVNGRIENCKISGNEERGLALYDASNIVISDNEITENGRGIYLEDAPHNEISANTLEGNLRFGVYLVRSFDATIAQNAARGSLYGLRVYASTGVVIANNVLTRNEVGLLLDHASRNAISHNLVGENAEEGISLWRSSSNELDANVIRDNTLYGLRAWGGSADNAIYQNNVSGNVRNAWDEGVNAWDNGSSGNFWDDYTGTDADGDGIGEVSYAIPDNGNRDRYPLMAPWPEAGPQQP